MRATLFLLFAGTLAMAGCDRTHLSPTYGQSVRKAYHTQVVSPGAGERPYSEQGLDPEEAAIVSKGYRESLSPKKEDSGKTPLVVVPTPQQPGAPPAPGPGR